LLRYRREDNTQEERDDDAPKDGAALLSCGKRRCREADGDSVVAGKREIDQDDRKQRCKVGHCKVWIEEIGEVGGQ
jgi:hypothetical protein